MWAGWAGRVGLGWAWLSSGYIWAKRKTIWIEMENDEAGAVKKF